MRQPLTQIRARRPSSSRTFRTRCLSVAAVGCLFAGAAAHATTTSPNTGSLGSAANGTNANPVTFAPGVVTAGGDQTAVYNGADGTNTTVPFQSGLNPGVASPFTVEFWAKPAGSDNDDAVVSNRVAAGNRSGWVFFQRDNATGWNFRMYNGNGSALGWDLTGGTANLNAWSHVAATWNGSTAQLFVNGTLADSSNDPAATGVYNPNSATANLIVASSDTGSPYNGAVDEVAFYPSLLSNAQILNHFNSVSSGTPGAYQSLVRSDGALLQLSNVPEPAALLSLSLGTITLFRRRRI